MYLPDNLTGLSVNLFKNCPALASITLRGNMKWINAGVFDGCTALKEVKSYNLVPPVATATSFMDSHYTEAQLFVPDEAADAYKNDEVWKNFISTVKTRIIAKIASAETRNVLSRAEKKVKLNPINDF